MKELSIEEKARRYDEAIERAREFVNKDDVEVTEYIFPELVESEDERISKELIEQVQYIVAEDYEVDDEGNVLPCYRERINKYIAWLEKQGSQNADKVEPKFKVGDWINNNIDTNKIIGIDLKNEDYLFENSISDISLVDNISHLWTIQDAKNGDVLADSLGNVCIYQEPSTKLMYHSYCYGNYKCFIDMGGSHVIVGSYPATKEQRDLLFQKMKEAGYEWDAEKKELKKIERNPVWSEEDQETIDYLIDYLEDKLDCSYTDLDKETFTKEITLLKSLKDRVQPKKEWSELDRILQDSSISYLCNLRDTFETKGWDKEQIQKCINWLKSIKDKVYPKLNQEWSDEDEATFTVIGSLILDNFSAEDASKTLTWLHSLRPNHWKPSDEQMKALDEAIYHVDDSIATQIAMLIGDLKKL